ncbi:hypothetical protein [Ruminococcus sp.]|uniref:hypothetical protein n=1 Tax=Ruminococcus sp. TaxID=41978 RepID=UPI0025DA4250|nr:hypothetical protein [Ruminococcus sp.]
MAVFTCCHVTEEGAPVLYVSHDDDGCRQFLCGRRHCEEEARLVSLGEIYRSDNTLGKLAGLGCGHSAQRENVGGKWTFL